jgi:D-alanine-D-alanine ligase
MKRHEKILICYNSPVSLFPVYNGKPSNKSLPQNDLSESGFTREIQKIKSALSEKFSRVETLAVDRDLNRTINGIISSSPDLIFNFVESVEGIASYEYCNAGIYELLQVPYTGNYPSALGNCLNKERAKSILRSYDIPTPESFIIKAGDRFNKGAFNLKYPVILKLLNEDASIGISELSVVDNLEKVTKQLNFLRKTYKQDVIIEEYIDGRELNVAILGERVLPVSEIRFNGLPEGLPKIVTYDGKWMENSIYYNNTIPQCPAKLEKKILKRIETIALDAFNAMSCRDYARVDIRLNEQNEPFVIEVNPNPDISTDSGFVRAASAAGINYSALLHTIAGFALSRRQHDKKIKAG